MCHCAARGHCQRHAVRERRFRNHVRWLPLLTPSARLPRLCGHQAPISPGSPIPVDSWRRSCYLTAK